MAERILIFDTTLRDGEQSPGCSMNTREKVELAKQLARLGVDVMEAGFPIASQDDFEAVRAVARALKGGPIVAGLGAGQGRGHRPLLGGGEGRGASADPHLHRDLRDSHQVQAEVHAGGGAGGDRGRREAGQGVHGRRGVLGRGCAPDRPGLPVPGRRGGDQGRGHHDQHPRHGGVRPAVGVRRADPQPHDTGCRGSSAWWSARTATTTSAWPWPTPWRRSGPGRGRWNAPSTASASARATPRWKSW